MTTFVSVSTFVTTIVFIAAFVSLCFKFYSFCWGQSTTINDQKREKWENCFFFLFEICQGADTIQM